MEATKNKIILEVLLTVLSSDASDESKHITCNVGKGLLMGKEVEFKIIDGLIRAYITTKQWPTYEFIVERYGYLCRAPNQKLSIRNSAEAVTIFESEIERYQRYELGYSLVELAKQVDTLPFRRIRDVINQSVLLIEPRNEENKVTLRESYHKKKLLPAGALTFIKPLDKDMGGVRKGTLLTLAGFAGHYKTRSAMSILYKNIVELKQNGVLFSLEMPSEIIWNCLLSRHSMHKKFAQYGDPIPSNRIMDTELTDKEEKFIFEYVEPDLKTNPDHGKLEILDRNSFTSLSFSGIRSKLLSLPFEPDLLLVDYIQLFRYLEDAKGLSDPGNQYMDFFMEMAVSLDGIPTSVIVLSQINRQGYARAKTKSGEYDLFDLAELNSIERDSAYVVCLYLDENLRDSGEIKINMPKNRFGRIITTPIVSMVNPIFSIIGDELDEAGSLISDIDMMNMLEGGGFVDDTP